MSAHNTPGPDRPSERLLAESVAGEPPVSDHVMCGNCGPWERVADEGECHYCGHEGKVKREPFGGEGACRTCWEQICYGEDE